MTETIDPPEHGLLSEPDDVPAAAHVLEGLDHEAVRTLLAHISDLDSGPGSSISPSLTSPDAQELFRTLLELRMLGKFGIDEILTKINVLREEFELTREHSPIEHVNSRLKSPRSILEKVVRRGVTPSREDIRRYIHDIAGVRITCAFATDVYQLAEILTGQPDIRVVEVKDYIADPKPNGYQSLHLIVEVPVFLSQRTEHTLVEVQIRTIAMDFWASLEHKIYYKYDREVPQHLLDELRDAARVASELDERMARLRDEVNGLALTEDPRDTDGPAARGL
ncbi:GTP pyrophosphokinase family protein [Sediminivirga luteola]|uniref:GTP pyrophosphokinase n=1 Tax=Sediminivirga luteola TaxID=1774748 RepID=UPI0030DA1861